MFSTVQCIIVLSAPCPKLASTVMRVFQRRYLLLAWS
jgi:hypothetical protein